MNEQVMDDFLSDKFTKDCPECFGKSFVQSGFGHFGDCNGDAGEAWKPCLSACGKCGGRGIVEAE